MSETMQMWAEIVFDVAYLVVVWSIVIVMFRRKDNVAASDRPVAILFPWAFVLLAFGDTWHLGFRLLGFARGDLDFSTPLFGTQLGLVGMGALATAITMTFFYVLMIVIWQRRFRKPYGWFEYLLLGAVIVRFVLMAFPMNEWNNAIPVQPWGTYRNLPLMVTGWGIAFLLLRDAATTGDRPMTLVGWMIIISFICYTPVVFWIQKMPMLGMLMIPKTMAYVAIAFIANHYFYRLKTPDRSEVPAVSTD
ncbi:MAG: hypothetical protein GY805_19420 [Chloroflexi bacterium]|nr:hypothetical protein [Chloroflexota bacterium]